MKRQGRCDARVANACLSRAEGCKVGHEYNDVLGIMFTVSTRTCLRNYIHNPTVIGVK